MTRGMSPKNPHAPLAAALLRRLPMLPIHWILAILAWLQNPQPHHTTQPSRLPAYAALCAGLLAIATAVHPIMRMVGGMMLLYGITTLAAIIKANQQTTALDAMTAAIFLLRSPQMRRDRALIRYTAQRWRKGHTLLPALFHPQYHWSRWQSRCAEVWLKAPWPLRLLSWALIAALVAFAPAKLALTLVFVVGLRFQQSLMLRDLSHEIGPRLPEAEHPNLLRAMFECILLRLFRKSG